MSSFFFVQYNPLKMHTIVLCINFPGAAVSRRLPWPFLRLGYSLLFPLPPSFPASLSVSVNSQLLPLLEGISPR